MSYFSGAASGLRPYHFTYPERRLTMEEMLYKFVDEGKREHEEMRAFICEFRTTNKIFFKERNNLLGELRFEVQELLKVINNTPMTNCEIKGVTTRGGKTTTHDVQTNSTNIHTGEPLVGTTRSDGVKSEHLYSASTNEINEKRPELKSLPNHLKYTYLQGDKSFPIIISSKLSKKDKKLLLQVLEKHKGAIAWKMSDIKGISPSFCTHKILIEDDFKPVIQPQRRMPFGLFNAPATFQRCMTAIFHDIMEDFMEVFMDDFSVFCNSFYCCLANLEEISLVLNWEKCQFMVKERIVLGHKISGAGIEVDRAKIDVIAKLPYPTNVKGGRSFRGHAGFYRRVENLVVDHLSRLENPDLRTFTEDEITDELRRTSNDIEAEINDDEPWYADYVNYIVGKIVPPKWTQEKRRRFFSQVKNYFWDEPYAFRLFLDNVMRRCVAGSEIFKILAHCHSGPTRGHHSASITRRKVYESGFFWPSIFKDAKGHVMRCDACKRSGNISSRSEMP
ncbi:reverse transcriptase domain-containing protein [Tanacetum coccineum]